MITLSGVNPMAICIEAFTQSYPGVAAVIDWNTELDLETGRTHATYWPDDCDTPRIQLDPCMPVTELADALTHELAHVAVGRKQRNTHGKAWKAAFHRLSAAYDHLARTGLQEAA